MRVDRSQFAPAFALRCAAGVAIPLIAALLAGNPRMGVAGAIGAVSTGFASQQGFYRTRAAAMLATALAMSVSTIVAAFASEWTPALVVLMALWGYGYGVLASLGPASGIVGLQSVVAFVIFGGQGLTPVGGFEQALLVLGGGLLQTLLLVVVWPLSGYSAERKALAGTYRQLAEYAGAVARGEAEAPGSQAIAQGRVALADPQPFARRGDIAVFRALLDEAERIRATLAALAADVSVTDRTQEPDVSRALEACAELLEEVAGALGQGRAPGDAPGAWQRADPLPAAMQRARGSSRAPEDAAALLGQLRSAWSLVAIPSGGPSKAIARRRPSRATRAFPRLADQLATLRVNVSLRSPYAQHGLRLAVTLGAATLLARTLAIPHGYWMALTAAIVLRPDFTTTFVRGFARILGTVIGAAFASTLALIVPANAAIDVVLAILFAGLTFALPNVNYGLFAIALTSYVVFLFSLLGTAAHTAGIQRIVATILGGGLAELAIFLYPTWEGFRVPLQLAKLLDAQRRYADAVFHAYIHPSTTDEGAIAAGQTALWSARSEAEASVDRMLAEPPQTHAMPGDIALGILAASRRFGFGVLTLNAHHASVARVPRPALRTFVHAIDQRLRSLAGSLRTHSPPRPTPPLRAAFDEARAAHAGSDDPDAAEIFTECDLLVDSVNTLAGLVARGFPRQHDAHDAGAIG